MVALLSGVLVPVLLLLAGGYFAVRLTPLLLCRRGAYEKGKGGGLRALGVALAGTLGVGNIAGVAVAIALGGAGAVFWMWVSAFLAMLLKYAEVVLALRTRIYDEKGMPHGGAPYYIRRAFKGKLGRVLAAVFALLCLGCALTLGSIMQSAAASEAMASAFSIPPILTGAVLGVAALIVLAFGAVGVEHACGVVVPLMCAFFTLLSIVALLLRRQAIPEAFARIFSEAFSLRSGGAGVFGFLTAGAIRYGVARGLVSNEAGCGTAPIAHASAPCTSPMRQGLLGMVEVLVDTILLCTLTALVILVSGAPIASGGGMRFALDAYAAILGPVAIPAIALSVLLFAFATVLCWSHYGAESLYALTGRKRVPRLYLVAIAASCVWGAVAAPQMVWDATDMVLALMTILNVITLFALRRDVLEETKE